MSRSGNSGGFSREDPAWLRGLWANQRVALSAGKLHGWSVHVQGFLGFVHRHEPEGPVGVLAGQFLEDMQLRDPPVGSWRLDQARWARDVQAGGGGAESAGRWCERASFGRRR